VSKDWGRFHLKNINLTVEEGEYFVLVGPTGSGKTLLLETILGFHELDSGKILHNSTDITDYTPLERKIGYVPQMPALSPQLTVRENIEFILKRMKQEVTHQKLVDGIIDMMSLKELENMKTINLSGGEKRKVALARALVLEPETILLDEPFNNLDITMKQDLREELRLIHNYLNLTVIHVTHDQSEALSLANRIGVINNGAIVNIGTVDEVFYDPKDVYAARFLGYQNIHNAELVEKGYSYSKMKIDNITLRAAKPPKKKKGFIALHSDEILVTNQTPENIKENIFPAIISSYQALGSIIILHVDVGIPLVINLPRRRFTEMNLNQGDHVWVSFSTEAVKQLG
jgi:molybdate/tungstate transport system ATP-binding protein